MPLFHRNISDAVVKIKADNAKLSRNRPSSMSDSEVYTLLIAFQHSDYRILKHFYCEYVCAHMRKDFPALVSCNRFVELTVLPGNDLTRVGRPAGNHLPRCPKTT